MSLQRSIYSANRIADKPCFENTDILHSSIGISVVFAKETQQVASECAQNCVELENVVDLNFLYENRFQTTDIDQDFPESNVLLIIFGRIRDSSILDEPSGFRKAVIKLYFNNKCCRRDPSCSLRVLQLISELSPSFYHFLFVFN